MEGIKSNYKILQISTAMTQEEKQLLLKDLCARLPYGVMIQITSDGGMVEAYYDMRLDAGLLADLLHSEDDFKPYLRPMSSMTEKESKEYRMFIDYSYNDFTSESTPCVYVDKIENYIDWLNEHQFDFRGLIGKGLALEAPEEMYE